MLWLEGAVSHFTVRTHREPGFNPVLRSHGPGEPHDTLLGERRDGKILPGGVRPKHFDQICRAQ